LNFKVFKDGKAVDSFDVTGAYLFGTDGIAIRKAQIEFKDGCIRCGRPNLETAGIVILWPVEGFGKVLLPTTCLPGRDRPFCLNVELARGKLMQIVNKCEDWAYFSKDGLGQKFEEARGLFIKALDNISDMPTASKLADQALKKALVFAEQLAARQADNMFKNRVISGGFGRGALGVKVDLKNITNQQYINNLCKLFGYAAVPINWASIEKNRGQYDFNEVDECIIALSKKRVALGGGPLLRFDEKYIPQWLLAQKYTFEKIRESAYRFVSQTVTRYANRIRTWSVVSGLNCRNHFGFSFEEVLELTRAANMAVKSVDAGIRKIIEVENPWGEYYASVAGSIPPLIYMDMVVQSGVNFDAFGLRMDQGGDEVGTHTRDMMQISAMLDFLSPIAKSFFISNVSVPTNSPAGNDSENGGQEQWDESAQAQWLERFFKIVLSKPFVESVIYSNLADSDNRLKVRTGLMTNDLQPKKSFVTMKKLRDFIFS
jgi:hypothetical protein